MGLWDRTREPIQQESVAAVFFLYAFIDDADNQVIRDQLAVVHVPGCLFPQLGTSLDTSTEHFSSGEMRDIQISHQVCSLCSLARSGWSDQYDPHG
jgi:hypothetical protein